MINWTIPQTINYSLTQSNYWGNLAGKSDVSIIGQYCSLFNTVAFYWIIAAIILLFTNPFIQKYLSQKSPRIARTYDFIYFALHGGFLLFILFLTIAGKVI